MADLAFKSHFFHIPYSPEELLQCHIFGLSFTFLDSPRLTSVFPRLTSHPDHFLHHQNTLSFSLFLDLPHAQTTFSITKFKGSLS